MDYLFEYKFSINHRNNRLKFEINNRVAKQNNQTAITYRCQDKICAHKFN